MWLIILLAVWALACLAFVSYELGWGCFWASLVLAVVAHFFLGFSIFTLAWTQPALAAKYGAGYLGIGLGWSSLKYWFKMRKARKQYIKDKKDWVGKPLEGIDLSRTSQQQIDEGPLLRTEADWIKSCKRNGMDRVYAPTVADNKWNILRWLWWWPFSVVAFLFEDFIRELWKLSWHAIRDIFKGIRKVALGEAARDLD